LITQVLASHPSVLSVSELFASVQPRAFPRGRLSGVEFWSLLSRPEGACSLALEHRIEPQEFLYPVDAGRRFDRSSGVPPVAATCLPSLTDDVDGLYAEVEQVVPGFPEAEAGAHYARLMQWLCARFGKEMWVERSGGSLLYVSELARHFPQARFVHLHRDGPETAISMSRHTYFRMRLIREMLSAALGDDPFDGAPCAEVSVPAELEPLLPWSFDARAFARLPIPIERFGVRWSATIINGTRHLMALPADAVAHMSYEALVAEPGEQLRRLIASLELPEPPPGWIEAASSRVRQGPRRLRELTADARARLRAACEPGARRLRNLP
jgi:hypothetical protein